MEEAERCRGCGEAIYFDLHYFGEWTHWHGDRWCHDRRGYTVTPLHAAEPSFHGPGDVL